MKGFKKDFSDNLREEVADVHLPAEYCGFNIEEFSKKAIVGILILEIFSSCRLAMGDKK